MRRCIVCGKWTGMEMETYDIAGKPVCTGCYCGVPTLFLDSFETDPADATPENIRRASRYECSGLAAVFHPTYSCERIHIDEDHGLLAYSDRLTVFGKLADKTSVFRVNDLDDFTMEFQAARRLGHSNNGIAAPCIMGKVRSVGVPFSALAAARCTYAVKYHSLDSDRTYVLQEKALAARDRILRAVPGCKYNIKQIVKEKTWVEDGWEITATTYAQYGKAWTETFRIKCEKSERDFSNQSCTDRVALAMALFMLEPGFTLAELKKRRNRILRTFHPDTSTTEDFTEEAKKINEAYELLVEYAK